MDVLEITTVINISHSSPNVHRTYDGPSLTVEIPLHGVNTGSKQTIDIEFSGNAADISGFKGNPWTDLVIVRGTSCIRSLCPYHAFVRTLSIYSRAFLMTLVEQGFSRGPI